jgi:hypothetical protein
MTPHTELALPTTPSPSILLRGDEIDTLRDFDGFAEDAHAHLERVCGAYITVTVLLVSDCDHPGLLAERIDQRASSRPVDPYLALPWRSLVEESIQQSAVAAYC